jgi:hypothetical protein
VHYGQLGNILMLNGLILMTAIPVFSLFLIEPTDNIQQFSKEFLPFRQSGPAAPPLW